MKEPGQDAGIGQPMTSASGKESSKKIYLPGLASKYGDSSKSLILHQTYHFEIRIFNSFSTASLDTSRYVDITRVEIYVVCKE